MLSKPTTCPHCHAPFEQFVIAGGVYRGGFLAWARRTFLGWPMQFAWICRACKDIVGWYPSDDEIRGTSESEESK